jgi:hypothetical protein
MLDELYVVIAQESQKDLLGHIIEVALAQRPQLPQRRAPASERLEPVRHTRMCRVSTHVYLDWTCAPVDPRENFFRAS